MIASGIAEYTISQINGLVAAIAEEDVFFRHALHLLQHAFQFTLQRVWIAVVWTVIGILVSIEEHVRLLT